MDRACGRFAAGDKELAEPEEVGHKRCSGDTSECLTLTLSREVNEKNRALCAGDWHSTGIRKISIEQRQSSNVNLQ